MLCAYHGSNYQNPRRVAVTTIEVNTFERNTGATTHTNSADEENCNSNKIAIHINSD